MLETLLTLTVAHILADFLLQTRWIINHKREPVAFGLHIAIVAALTCGFSGSLDPRMLGLIIVSHALADWAKLAWVARGKTPDERKARDTVLAFSLDQVFHLAMITTATLLWPSTVADGWWGGMPAEQQRFYFQALSAIGGVVLSVTAGGIVIDKLLERFGPHRDDPASATPAGQAAPGQQAGPAPTTERGLPGGGQAIGWLERGLTLLFLMIGQPEGVGLLLAAKSILRFSDKNARAHTEYVIIGSLLSFGWAIITAVLTRVALQHWG